MSRDSELDRLKSVQQAAFDRKQRAYDAQQSAWMDRKRLAERQARAYDRQQAAFARQNAAWDHLQAVKRANSSRIDSLNAQQEHAYQNMKNMFESASAAHERRDGAGAKSYAEQGHAYKAESQRCVEERRRLVGDIRAASAELRMCQTETAAAKAEFQRARQAFQDAKARHEQAARHFQEAKAAFQSRLQLVRENRSRSNREIAARAGIPFQYLDDVRVRYDVNGTANIYFGGIGAADGPGHGHYAIDRRGVVTYKRDPFDAHGAHNFTDWQADYADSIRNETVFGSNEFGFTCRYRGYAALVETGYDNQTSRQTINIYYGGSGHPMGPGHGHDVAYRDDPMNIVSSRRPSHPR